MWKPARIAAIAAAVIVGGLGLASCEGDQSAAVRQEMKARTTAYKQLQNKQPGEKMSYSPTRAALNEWSKTWDKPGKLSYVYLVASNGQKIGYYVFKGLPVSYCASLYPTYDLIDTNDSGDVPDFQVPAPSVDGVYYSGGQCDQYFGIDATTGTYMEFSAGGGLNFLVYEKPAPYDAPALGYTTIEEAEKQ